VLQAIAFLATADVKVSLYPGLANLPHFNPDLDTEIPPLAVKDFRSQLQESHAVLISTPEYAHGVPGVLKNALDWLVRSGELYEKPVAMINLSPRSFHGQDSLTEILGTMTARIVAAANVALALPSRDIDAAAICSNPDISRILISALAELVRASKSVEAR
jgi:chromate reductase, NAD(P)H dehydrogenase (quinone)